MTIVEIMMCLQNWWVVEKNQQVLKYIQEEIQDSDTN